MIRVALRFCGGRPAASSQSDQASLSPWSRSSVNSENARSRPMRADFFRRRPIADRPGRHDHERLDVDIVPVAIAPADSNVHALPFEIEKLYHRLDAQLDIRMLLHEGHQPRRQPARREIARHSDSQRLLAFAPESCKLRLDFPVVSAAGLQKLLPLSCQANAARFPFKQSELANPLPVS